MDVITLPLLQDEWSLKTKQTELLNHFYNFTKIHSKIHSKVYDQNARLVVDTHPQMFENEK